MENSIDTYFKHNYLYQLTQSMIFLNSLTFKSFVAQETFESKST